MHLWTILLVTLKEKKPNKLQTHEFTGDLLAQHHWNHCMPLRVYKLSNESESEIAEFVASNVFTQLVIICCHFLLINDHSQTRGYCPDISGEMIRRIYCDEI